MIIDDYVFYTKEYKQKYGEKTIVLMQVGSFFELYSITDDTDSEIYRVADICNITISKKNKSVVEVNNHNPLMAGFPLYTITKYQNILLQNNYTIVMIEQVTEPPNPDRKVTEIMSPGMNMNCNTKKTNYLMSIYYEKINNLLIIGISFIDISTGKCYVYEIGSNKDDIDLVNNEVFRLIINYNPCEIVFLCDNSLNEKDKDQILLNLNLNSILIHKLWNKYEYIDIMQDIKYQEKIFKKVYKSIKTQLSIIDLLNLEFLNFARISFCFLLQFAYDHNSDILQDIYRPEILEINKYLNLEYDSTLQLNIISLNNNDKPLLDILNRCNTSFGSRLFKDRLLNPIICKKELNNRYDKIELFMNDNLFKKISKKLSKILDLERIKRKITLLKLNPHEWSGFDISLQNSKDIFEILEYNNDILKINEIINYYNSIIDIDSACKYNILEIKSSIFKKGLYENVDELDELQSNLIIKINNIVSDIINIGKNNNIDTFCKLEYTDREGYHIQITKKRFQNLQSTYYNNEINIISQQQGYIKINTTDLNNYSKRLNDTISELSQLSLNYYKDFMSNFIQKFNNIYDDIINVIADIDITCCNASNSYEYRYYRPTFTDKNSGFINAKSIRHPIIERINKNKEYIGNDIELTEKGILLYGVNSSGKSSLMKAIGLNIIMAQSGMFVSSEEFLYEPYHHIFTRIFGSDNIYKGLSSFTVEMIELRNILKRSNNYSLILGDEICNGTESTSGIAIVASAIDNLLSKSSSFILATHLHELTKINLLKDYINNNKLDVFHLHISVINDIIFYERKLKEGSGSSVYGIEVCKSLDMPTDFMKNAEKIRKELQCTDNFIIGLDKSHYNKNLNIEKCIICNNESNDTHHINFQCNADNNGFFKNYHKNIEHNLVILCKKCHLKVHNNEITINGYKDTSEGLKLDYEFINNEKNQDCDNDYVFTKDDFEKIKIYISYNKNSVCYLRTTKTSKYNRCNDNNKILKKINNILKLNLTSIPNNLSTILIDYKL
jgi:DNA mismatch repair protein MutS